METLESNTNATFPELKPPPESMTDGIVTLRRWQSPDANAFCHVINSSRAEFKEWFPWADKAYTLQDASAFMDRKMRAWEEGRAWSFAIMRAGDDAHDQLLGCCDVALWNDTAALNAGYWLATERLGRGYATRAVLLLTLAAFEVMGAPAVHIVHDVANIRSSKIPQRLGFERVGEFQPLPGDENRDNRPDVAWVKYPGPVESCPLDVVEEHEKYKVEKP
jgi:RimJ/RimL family protein N-acetyltransferase